MASTCLHGDVYSVIFLDIAMKVRELNVFWFVASAKTCRHDVIDRSAHQIWMHECHVHGSAAQATFVPVALCELRGRVSVLHGISSALKALLRGVLPPNPVLRHDGDLLFTEDALIRFRHRPAVALEHGAALR